jgi:hypothetical protein
MRYDSGSDWLGCATSDDQTIDYIYTIKLFYFLARNMLGLRNPVNSAQVGLFCHRLTHCPESRRTSSCWLMTHHPSG